MLVIWVIYISINYKQWAFDMWIKWDGTTNQQHMMFECVWRSVYRLPKIPAVYHHIPCMINKLWDIMEYSATNTLIWVYLKFPFLDKPVNLLTIYFLGTPFFVIHTPLCTRTDTHTHIYIYIHIHIDIDVRVYFVAACNNECGYKAWFSHFRVLTTTAKGMAHNPWKWTYIGFRTRSICSSNRSIKQWQWPVSVLTF